MQIGASTLCGMRGTPRQAVEALAKRGFIVIEVVFESPHLLSSRDVADLSRLGREYGLDYSVHGPWLTHNLGHTDVEVRRMNSRLFSRCIQAAVRLRATHLVTHGSRMQNLYKNVGFQKHGLLDDFVREIMPVVREAANKGVRLVCENTHSGSDTFSDFETFSKVVKATGAGLCLDIAHADLANQRKELLSITPEYVHAADADILDHQDLHCRIGRGNVNFKWWMGALKRRGYDEKIILEMVKVGDLDSSRKALLNLWNHV